MAKTVKLTVQVSERFYDQILAPAAQLGFDSVEELLLAAIKDYV